MNLSLAQDSGMPLPVVKVIFENPILTASVLHNGGSFMVIFCFTLISFIECYH